MVVTRRSAARKVGLGETGGHADGSQPPPGIVSIAPFSGARHA
jgi:hypothetical protein